MAKAEINHLGILTSVKITEFYKEDGKTKDGGGNLSFGFGEYREEGKYVGVSGGRYLTCGIPSGFTPAKLADHLRKMADLIEATALKE